MRWAGVLIVLVVVGAIVITQAVLPMMEDEEPQSSNRTWLEYAWTTTPPTQAAAQQLVRRLAENRIERVYLEVAAWRADGTLLEGEYVQALVQALRAADPGISLLAWLRMSGAEIAQPERQEAVRALAQKAVQQWGMDGVQLNGRAVFNGSDSYIQLVRALREDIGPDAVLSITVPPDRLVADPEVPMGAAGDPELTWDVSYKQRVGLLSVNEAVVMAHASGLADSAAYEQWVAYQVQSYVEAFAELEEPPDVIIALPTYDAAPEHDPAVETLTAAARGVRQGKERVGKRGSLVKGVGLFEYKTTDSLEWAQFGEHWLGRK